MPKEETFVASDCYETMTGMNMNPGPFTSLQNAEMERPLVVVLEDDSANAWGLSLVLQDWGYRTLIGNSVAPIVAQLDAGDGVPAAAVCDFHLAGGENGVTAARALQERYGRNIAVIIMTASSGLAARRQADQQGFPVLSKPVDPDTLQTYLPAA